METVNDAVSRYWTRVADAFDGRASHVRHHEVWKRVVAEALGNRTGLRMLDLGTGTGACAIIAAELGHRVTAIDGSEGMLNVARREAESRSVDIAFVHAQIEEAEIEPGSFDAVTLRNVLWTVADPEKVLSIARHGLCAGGTLFVTDADWAQATNRADYDARTASRLPRHAGIKLDEISAMLHAAGFSEIRDFSAQFEEPPYQAMGSPPFFAISAVRS
ncbi:methyltransferase domain-containing protein [Rhizobium sp. EC-SD404]|uniref:class I SAM-dependent methyltransferase n=1 Tax=Rhizobium sp. EC-SD404 TaxID=2038389 RepID=UPI00125A9AF3|nr:methyltransferase domain-containing protein [Rhizobium sp. EC-SD404]VVT09698.1 Methyltransferase domain-containing protein [Rhizobium sp. EC-SD404]